MTEAYPLQWPETQPHSKRRQRAQFNTSFAKARDALMHELRLMGAQLPVLSTNVELRRDGLPYANTKDVKNHPSLRLNDQEIKKALNVFKATLSCLWALIISRSGLGQFLNRNSTPSGRCVERTRKPSFLRNPDNFSKDVSSGSNTKTVLHCFLVCRARVVGSCP